jgi:hypothetical protein
VPHTCPTCVLAFSTHLAIRPLLNPAPHVVRLDKFLQETLPQLMLAGVAPRTHSQPAVAFVRLAADHAAVTLVPECVNPLFRDGLQAAEGESDLTIAKERLED